MGPVKGNFFRNNFLQTRLRPSELNEMSRLLGPELIETLEDLRSELENLIMINREIREDRDKTDAASS